jgi:branched-chain amino acid transport system ATP-binding protein
VSGARVVLEARGLSKRFGGIVATDNVSLSIEAGSRHALIGPNGAGKTTLVNLLTGVLEPSAGVIRLNGEDITRLSPEARVARGMVRTFQISQLFDPMTPLETLVLAATQAKGGGGAFWRRTGTDAAVLERCEALLERFGLTGVMHQATRELPYGKRRLLDIATALACEPRVLLLDEPAAGVPAGEREELLQSVRDLPGDVSVLLIEHDMDLVFSYATRVTVLVNGAVLTEGEPEVIAADPRVKAVYLGHSLDHADVPGAAT